jgi:hypothetical protein
MRDKGPIGAVAGTVVTDATGTAIDDSNGLSTVGGGRSMT